MNHTDLCRSRRIQRFLEAVPRMLAACAYTHHTRPDDSPSMLDAVEAAVELCDESGRSSVNYCLGHYAYWGCSDVGADRRGFRDALKRGFERGVLRVYEAFERARFGAWRVRPGTEGRPMVVEAIDGPTGPGRREVVHATWSNTAAMRREATVAGWLVEVEGLDMLMLACQLEDRAAQNLAVAASRGAWGDNDHFRRTHYEADILALLLEPMCVDVGGKGVLPGARRRPAGNGGRVFLSPVIKGWGWDLASMELPDAIQATLTERGLEHRDKSMAWHLAVARAETAADVHDLMEQLDAIRQRALTGRLEPRHPLGPYTLETLVSSNQLMDMICPGENGPLGERHDYLEVSLRQLGVDSEELRRCGISSQWALEKTLRHSHRLSPAALDSLGDAIHLSRVRMRWTTLLGAWLQPDSAWTQRPSLADLLTGIEDLFRDQLWHLPLGQLPGGGRLTWGRLSAAIKRLGFTGLEVRVADLGEFAELAGDLPEVGPAVVDQAALTLGHLLAAWPSGPAWNEPSIAVDQVQ